MNAIIYVNSSLGSGFYEVSRTMAHVLNVEVTCNLKRVLRKDTVLFVGSIYGSITPLLLSTFSNKRTILYVTAEGPFNPGVRKFLVNKRTLIVTPSMYSARELVNKGMAVHKVIPHGIDTCELPHINYDLSSRPYIKILSIVGSDVYKVLGAMYLLKAFAKSRYLVTNSRLILKVPSNYAESFQQLAINLGIQGSVDIVSGYSS